MAELTYTNPQIVRLRASGYKPAPTGEIDIDSNGQYDVTDYASANVNVPEPSGNIDIVSNGEYDVKDYVQATVSVPLPTGEIELTENKRDYDVYNYATARVNVPEPTGTIRIIENKTENVKDYEFAEVDVQPTLITKQITENGTYTAADDNADGYSEVAVTVPQDSYEVMNAYITNTLTRLRLNHVPVNRLYNLRIGGNVVGLALTSLRSIEFPDNQDELPVWGYGNLTNLELFDGGNTTGVGNVSLWGCSALETLILRKADGVATLYSASSASLSNTNLKIYVPPTLIDDYKVATNWSTVPEKFRALYYANSDTEKEQLLSDPTIPDESMIICDYNETYIIKEATS